MWHKYVASRTRSTISSSLHEQAQSWAVCGGSLHIFCCVHRQHPGATLHKCSTSVVDSQKVGRNSGINANETLKVNSAIKNQMFGARLNAHCLLQLAAFAVAFCMVNCFVMILCTGRAPAPKYGDSTRKRTVCDRCAFPSFSEKGRSFAAQSEVSALRFVFLGPEFSCVVSTFFT